MENVKPWQIVLMVLAVGALAFTVWKYGISGGSVNQVDRFMTVDIVTGQLYDLRKGKAKGVSLPFKNPETGDRTLYPVVETDGSWSIRDGYLDNISEKQLENSKVRGGSGLVQVLDTEPIVHVVMK